MKLKIYQVDAFTEQMFKGNPAAVCILTVEKSNSWLQQVAAEMNLSETAFLYPKENCYKLRWFTPEREVNLCGHATLASAHVLWEQGAVKEDKRISFQTKGGHLTAQKNNDWIELNFPLEPEKETEVPDKLLESLDVTPKYIGKNCFDYLIEVESEQIVKGLKPNFNLLQDVKTRGVIVTSASNSQKYDFVSRFFAPRVGVNEDPVTGSAHCCLGAYWQKRFAKKDFLAYQASQRGGIIKVQVCDNERVILGGQATTVLEGEIRE